MSSINNFPDKSIVRSSSKAPSTSTESEKEDALFSGGSDAGHLSDSSSANFNAIDFDSFAMSSLQATASAIIAAQQQQQQQPQATQEQSSLTNQLKLQSQSFLQQSQISPLHEQEFHLHSNVVSGSESETGHSRQLSPTGLRRASSQNKGAAGDKPHVERHMWTPSETQALVNGCNKHGIGNWKAILNDQEFAKKFEGRTPGDLKDRFRTYFPDAYHEMYPNAKTHTSRAVRSKAPDGTSIFEKGKTKERRPFTPAEDDVLKRGYEKYGSHWAIIAKEPVFEGKRKSTDLRDRFRNAFPSLYEQAGYKPRAKAPKKERRQSSSGSMSQSERPALLTTGNFRDSFSFAGERPALAPRSETSTSVNSQAVSEHSEGEESDYPEVHIRDRSDGSFIGYPDTSFQSAASSLMSRSHSIDVSAQMQGSLPLSSSQNQQQVQQNIPIQSTSEQGNPSATAIAASGSSAPPSSTVHRNPLRRSHSSKRGSTKISSLEKAAKNASIKCNKEAILASHQQHHLQHLQQQQHAQAQAQAQSQAAVQGWSQGFNWDASTAASLADMDLDQIGELMDAHSTAQLLNTGVEQSIDNTSARSAMSDSGMPSTEGLGVDAASSNALLDNLYQQLGFTNQPSLMNRGLSEAPYQNANVETNFSNLSSSSLPFNPASSVNVSSIPSNAQRIDFEHSQWAGDLLPRGNPTSLDWNPEVFVNLANMQLMTGGAQSSNGQLSGSEKDVRPSLSAEHSLSMPSVHDFISRSTRRLSNPPRPVGLNEELTADSLLSSAYRTGNSYPADDISLINSNFPGGMTLFPSLMGTGPASDGAGPSSFRRRKSTDTLRENTFASGQAWRGPMEGIQADQSEDGLGALSNTSNLGVDDDGMIQNTPSQHSGQHSRSISSVDPLDDENAPSRAASVGDLDLVGGRENALYAESLPDLTTSAFGGGGEHSSSASDNAFPHVQHLQMSYDDLDLPSFLNRSPNFAPASSHSMNPISATTFNSPRMSAMGNDGANWLKLFAGGTRAGNPPTRDGVRSSSAGVGEGGQTMIQSSQPMSNQQGFDGGQFSTFAASLSDAGALDRLEHLYLEGLHSPGSPAQMNIGTPSLSAFTIGGNNQRFGTTSLNQVMMDRSNTVIAGEDANNGYESV